MASTIAEALTLKQLKPLITKEYNLVESFRKKLAIHTYRLGRLLTLANKQVEYGQWGVFLEHLGVSSSTDLRARDQKKQLTA
ncbi:hypothetical protein [Schlesneria sp. DSM 10557]|uniref:hypothetical protein n=1 Tax=Schlesneria sp. DSM 10557 TaxID=3044399 RepID=UPI00359F4BC2